MGWHRTSINKKKEFDMTTQVQTAQSQEKFVIKIDKNLAKIIDSDTRKN